MITRKKEILSLKNQSTHADIKLTFTEINDAGLTFAEVLYAFEQGKRYIMQRMAEDRKNYNDAYPMIDV